jgi:hypothetical protein
MPGNALKASRYEVIKGIATFGPVEKRKEIFVSEGRGEYGHLSRRRVKVNV